ncbi:MAG: protein kinase [Polyangiaceae bacterium]
MARSCAQCGNQVDVERFCPTCGAEQLETGPDADPLIGRVVAERYQVLELVNSGGMGRIYRGVQRVLDRPVAIKCILPSLIEDEETAVRFLEEARVASRLNHPNIVSIYDFGRASAADGGYSFLVMEYLSGQDLAEVLDLEPLLPLPQVVDIIEQTLGALAEAHEHGIAHRDIKPGNLMLESRRRGGYHVKLIDFGIARLRDRRRLTQVGIVIGTPQYMPLEKLRGEEPGAAGDLFAVSVMLYEMLTGQLPFPGPTAMDVVRQQMQPGAMLDPRAVAPDRDIPDHLAHACMRGLLREPGHRFPDALSMALAIAEPGDRAALRASRMPGRQAPTEADVRRAITQATRRDRTTMEESAEGDEDALRGRAPWATQLLAADRPTLIWGRPGVGRTWLVERGVRELRRRGIFAERIEAPPRPLDQIGYGGLRKILRQLMHWRSEEELRTAIEAIDDVALHDALQGIFNKAGTVQADAAAVRAGAQLALRWAIEHTTTVRDRKPFVLVLDDLDRLDGASFQAVADFLGAGRMPGFALWMTAANTLAGTLPVSVLRQQLRGWSREQALEQLGEQRGLLQRSDNEIEPMYVEQLVASFEDDSWSAPVNMSEAVEQRLRVLPPDAICTLQALAVCGPSTVEVLARVVEHPEDAHSSLLPLAELGLIDAEEGRVRFTHPLIAEATLRLAPVGALSAVHERAAAIAEERKQSVEVQAYHALRGRPDFEAFLLVEECVRLRLRRGDLGSAIAALEDGIEAARTLLLRDEDEIAKSGWLVFGRKLGELLRSVGRVRDAARVLAEALDLTEPNSSARAHILGQLARVAESERRKVEREILAAEALRIAEVVGESQLASELRGWDAPPAQAEVHPPSASRPGSRRPHRATGQRVLVVEDDRELARALGRWLRRKGHDVTLCYSVADASALETTFACGIFDVMLPDGSGLELAEAMRDAGKVESLVFFTSSEEAGVAAIAESLGQMVRKSRGLLELEAVVDAALPSVAPPAHPSAHSRSRGA